MRRQPIELVEKLQSILKEEVYVFTYNEEENTLRIEEKTLQKGLTLSLGGLVAKWEREEENAITELVYYIKQAISAMQTKVPTVLATSSIYPVIRSTSFPTVTSDGQELLFEDHTAETRIYYAIDFGNTYRLIDKALLQEKQWDETTVKQAARENIKQMEMNVKEDVVAGNTFYFLRTQQGYEASCILNTALLDTYKQKNQGETIVGVPHEDVLIIADIVNEIGYDVMGQMMMQFFMKGSVPITSLSFVYDNGRLEPIFILGKKRNKN